MPRWPWAEESGRRDAVLAASVAIAAMAVAGFATRGGLGLSPDSIEYLGVARNLLRGEGLTVPFGAITEEPFPGASMTGFPPLHSILLAAGGAGLGWARALGLALYGVTAASVALVARRHAGGRVAAACVAALLLSPDVLRVHAQAWSEPLFLALLAAGSLALVEHLNRPRRATMVALLATSAAAPMARYAGIVLPLAAAMVLARRRWFRQGAAVAAAGAVPLLAWLAYGAAAVRTSGGNRRVLGWHPPDLGVVWSEIARTVEHFWLPGFEPGLPLLVIALLLVALAPRRSDLLLHGTLVAVGTVALLLVTWALFDRTTLVDSRLLVGAHLGVVLALPGLVRGDRWWRVLALGMAAVLVVAGGLRFGDRFPNSPSRQFALTAWETSPTLRAAAAVPAGTPLYSNAPDALWWVTGRPAALVPLKVALRSGRPQPWQAQLRALPPGAVLVLVDGLERDVPTAEEIAAVVPLRLQADFPDGALYELTPSAVGLAPPG